MELEELIENTLRRKQLEEMIDKPEKEDTPLEGMDNELIKRFALFLFEENQNKSKLLNEMIVRLDEIGKGCLYLRNTSPQNLLNWIDKSAMQLKKLIPALKKTAFQDGVNHSLPANPDESRSELNYLKSLWKQIFAYRNDDEYSIDNLPSERALGPITIQRKNSLFFRSVKGIQNSAIYNTLIENGKEVGTSLSDYFCKLLRELKKGRTDYENLLPMTICK